MSEIDDRLNSKNRAEFDNRKLSVIQVPLVRIMPNVGGLNTLKRKIIARLITSIRLYASLIWSEALFVVTKRKNLLSVYCLRAIRMISGFRIVSGATASFG